MDRGRWVWAAALAIAAGASGCDEGGAPARGFHSRQLVSIRDPTLSLVGFASKIVTVEGDNGPSSYYATDPDIAYYATGTYGNLTYWQMNLVEGRVTELGAGIPSVKPPAGSAKRFDCSFNAIAGQRSATMVVADAETGETLASIDRVVGYFCARYPEGYLAVVRLDENDVGRLWTGRFDQLAPAELDLAIDEPLDANWHYEPDPAKWRMTVLAAVPAPAGRGIYDIDLAQLTTTQVIAPALAEVTWAAGATPSGSSRSEGLSPADVTVTYGSGGSKSYLYRRLMDDGSEAMFAGPVAVPDSRELALFPIAGETASVFLSNQTVRNVFSWQQTGRSGSDTDLFLNWDSASARMISCPIARGVLPLGFTPGTTRLMGVASPDFSRYAFAEADAVTSLAEPPGPLIELSLAGAGSCAVRATRDVKRVVLANEAVAWIESPEAGGNETLWVAGRPGDAPRAIGSAVLLEALNFIAPNMLQVYLGTDAAWLDVRDDPVKLHYVAEGTFGLPTTGPRWMIIGYDLSSQDGTGTLGVVDWRTGDKHVISAAVLEFRVSAARSSERPLSIVYQVRGRSASPQDGIWAATIDVGDLP
jgi:hypothetical protein